MTERDSQGEKGGEGENWKKLRTFLLFLFAIALIASVVVAIYFAVGYWLSDNIVKHPPQPLDVAVAVLTILVAIVAIYIGYTSTKTKSEWENFEKEQKPIIEKLQKDRDELMTISKLKDKVLPTDPYLRKDESQEVVESITRHYNKNQDNEAWEVYGVGRSLDMDININKNYEGAIEYYDKALKKYPTDEVLNLHIHQSLGIDHFWLGRQHEINGKNADAIECYKEAIKDYDWVLEKKPQFEEANNNKAITLIQLGKIENKPEHFGEAINILGNLKADYDHFYDKARALALLNQKDEAVEYLTRAFKLAELEGSGEKLFKDHLKPDLEDFKNIEGKAEFQALLKRYRVIFNGQN